MSVQAMAWAMKQQIVTSPAARHVLLILANYCGEDGRGAFPAVSTIARDTGFTDRAVQLNIAKLREAGVIRPGFSAIAGVYIGRMDRHPNVWDLVLGEVVGHGGTPRGERGSPGNESMGEPDSPVNVMGEPSSPLHGVNVVRERGEPDSPYPPINHQYSYTRARKPKFEIPDWLPADAWSDFDTFRKAKSGAAWTQRAKELAVIKLGKLRAREDVTAVINQSIENGWAGLFPVRNDAEGKRNDKPRESFSQRIQRKALAEREQHQSDRAIGFDNGGCLALDGDNILRKMDGT